MHQKEQLINLLKCKKLMISIMIMMTESVCWKNRRSWVVQQLFDLYQLTFATNLSIIIFTLSFFFYLDFYLRLNLDVSSVHILTVLFFRCVWILGMRTEQGTTIFRVVFNSNSSHTPEHIVGCFYSIFSFFKLYLFSLAFTIWPHGSLLDE